MGLVEIELRVAQEEKLEESLQVRGVYKLDKDALGRIRSYSYIIFNGEEEVDRLRSGVKCSYLEIIANEDLERITDFASALQLISTTLINGKEINVRLSEIPVSYDFINEVWPGFAPGRVRIFNNPNEIDFLVKLIYRDESEDNLRKNIKVSLQSERGITLKMSTDLDSSDTI